MPQWQNLPILLGGGVDTKTDPRLVASPKLLRCENARFDKTGGLRKRGGYDALGNVYRDVGADPAQQFINSASFLATRADELVVGGYQTSDAHSAALLPSRGIVASYNVQRDEWIQRGVLDCPGVAYEQVRASVIPEVEPAENDFVEAYGYRFVAWSGQSTLVHGAYAIYDATTGAVIQTSTFAGRGVRWAVVGASVLLFYSTGPGTIICRIFNATNLPILPSAVPSTTIGVDGNVSTFRQLIDTASVPGQSAVIAYRTAGNDIKIGYVSELGVLGTNVTVAIAAPGDMTFAVEVSPTGIVALGYQDDAVPTPVHVNSYAASSLALLQAVNLATGGAGTDRSSSVGLVFSTSAFNQDTVLAVFGQVDVTAVYWRTHAWAVNVVTGNQSARVTLRALLPISRPYIDDDSTSGAVARLYATTGFVEGGANPGTQKVAVGVVLNITAGTGPSLVSDVGPFAYININRSVGIGFPPGQATGFSRVMRFGTGRKWRWIGTVFSQIGAVPPKPGPLILVTHDFDVAPKTEEMAQSLYISGGILLCYDGQNVTEVGMLTCPHQASATPSNGAGGMTPLGVYAYKLYWERTTALGQVVRSTFGGAVSVTMGAADDTVTLVLPGQGFVTRDLGATLGVYRAGPVVTTASAFRRVSSIDPNQIGAALNPYLPAQAVLDTLTFVDGMSDNLAASQPPDYTFGGVVDNAVPGGGSVLFKTDERLIVGNTTDDPTELFFSKLREYGDPVDFNDDLRIIVGDTGGLVTGGSNTQSYIIILEERAVYACTGDGPNNTLSDGSFAAPRLITDELGCVNPYSVVMIPSGLMFRAQRGIYLLNTQLTLDYVGAAVERFNDQTITAAVLVPEESEARFLCASGVCLVYNYVAQAWSTWTNHEGTAATLWEGRYVYATPTGEIRLQSDGFTDPGNRHIPLVIETPWIRVAGPQGYQKARRLHILGEYRSPHLMQIQMAYDYEESWMQIHRKWTGAPTTSTLGLGLGTSYYGEGAFYGSNVVYGGSDTEPNLTSALDDRMKLDRQKCEAVRFRWEDVDEGSAPGESFAATLMSVEIGGEPGKTWPARQGASG